MPDPHRSAIRRIETSTLSIAYEERGAADGATAVLLHGFPYSPRAYDAVADVLAARGLRVIVPYLRGFGPTQFRDSKAMRSGEQAALGMDLVELLTALKLERPVVAGYDWGGRAACVVSAIRPDLVGGLVTGGGYNLFGPAATAPLTPEVEHVLWYQYYLHTERGRAMLETNRHGFCRLLWKLWSPRWAFDEATFAQSAIALDNPDFVEVVLHSYRHRSGLVTGDPVLGELAALLEREQPSIDVPTIALYGDAGPLGGAPSPKRDHFTAQWEYRVLAGAGHNLPQEAPQAFAAAVIDLAAGIMPRG